MNIVKTLATQLIVILVGSCVLLSQPISAKEVEALFEISVPVDDQSNSKRLQATKEALKTIVVRVSGRSSAATNSIFRISARKSSTYIQRYLYRKKDITNDDGSTSQQLMLDLFFDESSIRNLLKETGLPRWGSNRPEVLIWLAMGNQQQRFLLGTENQELIEAISTDNFQIGVHNELEPVPKAVPNKDVKSQFNEVIKLEAEVKPTINLQQIISEQAKQRGLPIILPLMDLEDSINITVTDVWGRFVQPIRLASNRYNHDAIVAAQILKTEEGWFSNWLMLHKDRTISWELQAESLESSLKIGVDTIADQLANQYGVFEDSLLHNELLISVRNISSLKEYAALMDYLQSLTSIHAVNIAKVQPNQLHLRITLIGERESMLQEISLNNQLSVETMQIFEAGNLVTQLPSLFFSWNSVQ